MDLEILLEMQINLQIIKYLLHLKSDNQRRKLIIEDDGIGFPKDIIQKLENLI